MQEEQELYPLSVALEVAGVKPGKFHRHLYGGALGRSLAEAGELVDHISEPARGAGMGRGGGRFVTIEGTIFLGVFFRLVSGGVHSAKAVRIAQSFTFFGETGSGARAFKSGSPRPVGNVFPDTDPTFLVALLDTSTPETAECDGFAFVPGPDLTAAALTEWLGLHDADMNPVCVFNLSEVCRDIRAGLERCQAMAVPVDADANGSAVDWSEMNSDPLGAFLADCAVRDDKARTPTVEFFRAFSAWYVDWTGAPLAREDGSRAGQAVLQVGLAALGIRKLKSNGIMTFAGFRWRATPTVQGYLAVAPESK
jgi:hypothetical protein